jgi:hypothetical protein
LVKPKIRSAVGLDLSVLITRETGLEKELVARQIHDLSARQEETMIQVNFAAVPEVERHDGNWAAAARELGLHRSNLHNWLSGLASVPARHGETARLRFECLTRFRIDRVEGYRIVFNQSAELPSGFSRSLSPEISQPGDPRQGEEFPTV